MRSKAPLMMMEQMVMLLVFALAAALHFFLIFGVTLMQPFGLWAGEGYILLVAGLIAALCYPLLRRWRQPPGGIAPEK